MTIYKKIGELETRNGGRLIIYEYWNKFQAVPLYEVVHVRKSGFADIVRTGLRCKPNGRQIERYLNEC